jgi:hypothetical protein
LVAHLLHAKYVVKCILVKFIYKELCNELMETYDLKNKDDKCQPMMALGLYSFGLWSFAFGHS